jgi:hypothetical protein
MEHAEYTTGMLEDAMNLWQCARHQATSLTASWQEPELMRRVLSVNLVWRQITVAGDLLKLVIGQGMNLAVIGVGM